MIITILISSLFLLYKISMYILDYINKLYKPTTLYTTIFKNYLSSYDMYISLIISIIVILLIEKYNKTFFDLLGVIGIIYIVVDYLIKF